MKILGRLRAFLLGVWVCSALVAPAAESGKARPNIILILADDLGFSDLGCYGSEIPTPHLDALARGGLQFTQFYTTPRCCPTRAALLTGVYPQQAGIGGMMEDRGVPGYRGELSNRCLTIGEELRLAGYRTLMVGKWHVCHIYFDGKRQLNHESETPFWENKNGWPLQRGFDEFFGTIHGVNSYYDPFSLVRNNTPIQPEGPGFYYTDNISDEAVAEIERHARGDRPFFLYVAYTAPHWPLQAPPEAVARLRPLYRDGWDLVRTNRYRRQIELGIIDMNWPLPPRDSRVPSWADAPNKEWEANRMATYAAMVERLDAGVGRIVDMLKRKGIDQNTLVLFMSDNGGCAEVIQRSWYDVPTRTRDGRPIKIGDDTTAFAGPEDVWQSYGLPWANVSDTPFRLYKHFTHEGGISTPLIISWPDTLRGRERKVDQVGHVTDLMATFVEAAGAKHPPTFQGVPVLPLEGESLLPVLRGETRQRGAPIFWEHEGNRAVRQGRWKLVSQSPNDWELYNVEVDRTEQNNLAAQHPDVVKRLSDSYDAWAKRCGVLLPAQLPPARKLVPAALEP